MWRYSLNVLLLKTPMLSCKFHCHHDMINIEILISYVNFQNSWLASLKNRFKEHRTTLTANPKHEQVNKAYGVRKKRQQSPASDQSICRKKLKASVVRSWWLHFTKCDCIVYSAFVFQISISENIGNTEYEFSAQFHSKVMQDKLKKKKPNVNVLTDRFIRTYIYHWKDVLSGKPTGQIV